MCGPPEGGRTGETRKHRKRWDHVRVGNTWPVRDCQRRRGTKQLRERPKGHVSLDRPTHPQPASINNTPSSMGMLIDVIGVGAMGKGGNSPHYAPFLLAPLSTKLRVGKGGRVRPSSHLRQSYTAKGGCGTASPTREVRPRR